MVRDPASRLYSVLAYIIIVQNHNFVSGAIVHLPVLCRPLPIIISTFHNLIVSKQQAASSKKTKVITISDRIDKVDHVGAVVINQTSWPCWTGAVTATETVSWSFVFRDGRT